MRASRYLRARPLAAMPTAVRAAVIAAALLALAACGSGGGEGDGSRQRAAPQVSRLEHQPPYPWIDGRVDFNAACVGNAPMRYSWDFGDGGLAPNAEADISHTYTTSGRHTIRVTCVDGNGRTQTLQQVVSVYPRDLASTGDANCYSEYWGHAWCRQTPRVQGILYRQVIALDAERLWGIGPSRNVRRSFGITEAIHWLQSVTALSVISPTRAWAASDGTVRYNWTADADNWEWDAMWAFPQTPPEGPVSHLQAVSDTVVWALGQAAAGAAGPAGDRIIQRTQDGGRSWARTDTQPAAGGAIRTLFARDADAAWVIGEDGRIERTVDGGRTWAPVDPPTADVYTTVGLDPQRRVAWMLGAAGPIVRLNLETQAWDVIGPLPEGSGEILSIAPYGEDTAWFAGTTTDSPSRGLLMRLDAGGNQRSWRRYSVPSLEQRLLSVTAYARDKAWVAGERSLLHVTAQRTSIEAEASGVTAEDLPGFSAVNADIAWALGRTGTVLRTDNGGLEWQRTDGSVPADSRAVLGLSDSRAVVLDGTGGLWGTTNAGTSWQAEAGVPVGVTALLRGDAGGHWLLGRSGLLALWNPGADAQAVGCVLPADVDFGAGAARDGRSAWLLGRTAGSPLPAGAWDQLWHVEDGGARCSAVALEGVHLLRTVTEAADGETWVVGRETEYWGSGVVWHSRDGGRNWQRLPMPFMNDAVAITAWPGAGAWLATTDAVWKLGVGAGGLEVHNQVWLEPDTYPLVNLHALDAQTLWGAGAFGQVWRTLTGGETVRP